MAARGCGASRVAGGIYVETLLSDYGTPLSYFLIDPPIRIQPKDFGLTEIGVQIFERDGVWHLLDWVGSKFYPNVSDFIEEMKHLGLSRRVAETLPFSKLTQESKIFLVHSRAWIENYNLYQRGSCPKQNPVHATKNMCIGLYWRDHDGSPNEEITVTMPSFSYKAWGRPNIEPEYAPAIFAGMPIHQIAVIEDEDGKHEKAYEKAKKAKLKVEIKEE